jgi:lipopolysaccharide transport system permease protein
MAQNPHKKDSILIIEPSHGWSPLQLQEFWEYRELLYFLSWRDVKVRYKQTALGVAWALVQPFLSMVIFSLFFGYLARMPSDGIPYPIFAYTGLVPWIFFASSLQRCSTSLVANAQLLHKVYFPRLLIPIASILPQVVDFLLAFTLLLGMMLYFGIGPTPKCLCLIPLFLLALTTALGVGLWLSAINVHYRDIAYTMPFLNQVWMFATPVVYPGSLLPKDWQMLYAMNPMVGVIEGFRWALLGTATAPGSMIIASTATSLVVLVTGALYFRRVERRFADIV